MLPSLHAAPAMEQAAWKLGTAVCMESQQPCRLPLLHGHPQPSTPALLDWGRQAAILRAARPRGRVWGS